MPRSGYRRCSECADDASSRTAPTDEFKKTVSASEQDLAMVEKVLGPEHPDVATIEPLYCHPVNEHALTG